MVSGRRLDAVDARPPLDVVDVELEDALLAEDDFGRNGERQVVELSHRVPAGAAEEVLYQLLRDRRRAARYLTIEDLRARSAHLLEVEAPVFPEAAVLGSEDGVRDVARESLVRDVPLLGAILASRHHRLDSPL
jgi:hypothetical protein